MPSRTVASLAVPDRIGNPLSNGSAAFGPFDGLAGDAFYDSIRVVLGPGFRVGSAHGGPADRDWTRSHGVGGEMVRLSRHTDGGRVVSMHTDN